MPALPHGPAPALAGLLGVLLALPACGLPDSFASLTPSSLDFGAVAVGELASKQLEICNVGDRELGFELSAAPPFSFEETADSLSFILPEGTCADVAVYFRPDAPGLFEEALSLSFTDKHSRVTGGLDVPLAGTGSGDGGGTSGTGDGTGGGGTDGGGTDGGTGGTTGGGGTDGGTGGTTGGGGTDGGGTDGGGTDGGTGGTTDGGGTGGGSTEDSPCPDYSGVNHPGYVRTYVTTAAYEAETGGSGTYTTWTESIDADGRALVWVEATTIDRLGGELTELSALTYRCDDSGMALESYTAEGSYSSSSSEFEQTEETTYTDSLLQVVHELSVGDHFEDDWARETTTWSSVTGMATSAAFGDIAAEVLSAGATTVAAGTFDTLEISVTTRGSDGTRGTDVLLLDRELGLIASDDYELLSIE